MQKDRKKGRNSDRKTDRKSKGRQTDRQTLVRIKVIRLSGKEKCKLIANKVKSFEKP